ncbi:hypothetical protein Q5P01_020725 [Channa striata]|uniref:Uncharacterized protein n=1 Tax=Channa striata TaxID=64152 RepID=A0AA88SBP4_CHASR|nr:hypothetical protein Q5P01_020725 [Channa striata]
MLLLMLLTDCSIRHGHRLIRPRSCVFPSCPALVVLSVVLKTLDGPVSAQQVPATHCKEMKASS